MKIVLDARTIRSAMTGVGNYTANLARQLPLIRPEDQFVYLVLESENTRPITAPNVEYLIVSMDPERHPCADFWEHFTLPRILKSLEADVFHGPAFLIPFFKTKPIRRIVTIHDLSVFTFPTAYPLKFRIYLRQIIYQSIKNADEIIAVSDYVRREILRLFPQTPASKIHAIHSAASVIYCPVDKKERQALRLQFALPESYLLMVGTFELRKNPQFLIQVMQSLKHKLGDRTPSFLWAGSIGYGAQSALRQSNGLHNAGLFHLLGHVGPNNLRALYQCADALVYPSLDEGFGLPLVEAMSCGIPVIASNASSIPEIVGTGGKCLPLHDPDIWAESIGSIIENGSERSEASAQALIRSRDFSWEKTAQETAAIYNLCRKESGNR